VAGKSGARFAGRRAVVTGGARGIGAAIGAALLDQGAEVVALDRDWKGESRGFEKAGGSPETVDFASADTAAVARELVERYGKFDLIVNNVGVATQHGFLELEPQDFDAVHQINLRGPWFFTRELVKALVAAGSPGAVLFVSSLHSRVNRTYPAYSTSKAGIVMLAKEMARELGPHRIRVNTISPGWIHTGKGGPSRAGKRAAATLMPLGRVGEPGDAAGMALALLDEQTSGYVTGADVAIDGGLDTHTWLDADNSPR
jgi:NAD(P)-dependent dehydrogenase (short-subunit alcohol dehydrogenase family)